MIETGEQRGDPLEGFERLVCAGREVPLQIVGFRGHEPGESRQALLDEPRLP